MARVTARWSGGSGVGVLVHGGAGAKNSDSPNDRGAGCRDAAERAWSVLKNGGSALDAVERAVKSLEDDERYNAGRGATLTEDGTVELDAAIMDGSTLAAGAVCALTGFPNPVAIARRVLQDGRHVLYAGHGARKFALAAGFAEVDPDTLVTEEARRKLRVYLGSLPSRSTGGTVGAVARDSAGHVAAATSTGGTIGKRAGRVGDSPLVGAGTYADDAGGAASATGHGEGIIKVVLSASAVRDLAAGGVPDTVAADLLERMAARPGSLGGLVLVDAGGRLGFARTTEAMAWAAAFEGGAPYGE